MDQPANYQHSVTSLPISSSSQPTRKRKRSSCQRNTSRGQPPCKRVVNPLDQQRREYVCKLLPPYHKIFPEPGQVALCPGSNSCLTTSSLVEKIPKPRSKFDPYWQQASGQNCATSCFGFRVQPSWEDDELHGACLQEDHPKPEAVVGSTCGKDKQQAFLTNGANGHNSNCDDQGDTGVPVASSHGLSNRQPEENGGTVAGRKSPNPPSVSQPVDARSCSRPVHFASAAQASLVPTERAATGMAGSMVAKEKTGALLTVEYNYNGQSESSSDSSGESGGTSDSNDSSSNDSSSSTSTSSLSMYSSDEEEEAVGSLPQTIPAQVPQRTSRPTAPDHTSHRPPISTRARPIAPLLPPEQRVVIQTGGETPQGLPTSGTCMPAVDLPVGAHWRHARPPGHATVCPQAGQANILPANPHLPPRYSAVPAGHSASAMAAGMSLSQYQTTLRMASQSSSQPPYPSPGLPHGYSRQRVLEYMQFNQAAATLSTNPRFLAQAHRYAGFLDPQTDNQD